MTAQAGPPGPSDPAAFDELVVVFPASRGVARWHERDRESPVPGRWPYGLDELATPGLQLVAEEVPVPGVGRLAKLTGRVRSPRHSDATRVALCWDENTALGMAARTRAGRRYAGVIWATDAAGGGQLDSILRLQRAVLRGMDGLWVLCRPQLDRVRAWLGPDAPPVHFLRFGVDATFYRATPYPQLTTCGQGAARPKVVSVGGDRDRDAATLFAALALVLDQRPEVECVVQSSSDLAPPPGVRKLAHIPHDGVRRLFAEASVVALATRPNWHASGMTVALESMACARPVVASATPGMEDYIDSGATGELVAPQDPRALAHSVLELLADRDRAARMGLAGRAAVERIYHTGAMCAALREIAGVSQ